MVETQRVVEWVQRLVRIPSVGPANAGPRSGIVDEGRIAAQTAAWFEAHGGEVEQEDVHPGRRNTYGLWRGQNDRWIAAGRILGVDGDETFEQADEATDVGLRAQSTFPRAATS